MDQTNLVLLGLLFEVYGFPLNKLNNILFPMIITNPIRLLHYTYSLPQSTWMEEVIIQV